MIRSVFGTMRGSRPEISARSGLDFVERFAKRTACFAGCMVVLFIMVAPLVSDEAKALIGPWQFGGILFIAGVSFGIARVLKQPGADDL